MINKIKNTSLIIVVFFLVNFTVLNVNSLTYSSQEMNQEYINVLNGNDLDCFNSIISTIDNGYVVVGKSYSTDIEGIEGFVNKGSSDAIIIKYDKNGNKEWFNSFGGFDNESFESVIQTNDLGFIVVGQSSSTNIDEIENKNYIDAVIIKYDSNGSQQWVKSFGGNENDYFQSIVQTNDNGFIVVGNSNSTNLINIKNNGGSDAFIIKYDENGNQQWIKSFGGNDDDAFKEVIKLEDSSFVVVGYTYSTNIASVTNKGNSDAIIIKYDQNGNQQWIKSFGGNDDDNFKSIVQSIDGGFVVVGDIYSTNLENITNNSLYNGSDSIVIKYDENGNQQWIKSFGGSKYEYFNSVTQTSDDGFIVIGSSNSDDIEEFENDASSKAIIIKYDKDGNQLWVDSFGRVGNNSFESIIYITQDTFIIAGNAFYNAQGVTYSQNAIIIKYSKIKAIIPEETSANLNIEIVTDNSLELSISTNKISFEGYNGVEDLNNDKLSLTVLSGLYYDLYATLDSEIRGTNDNNAIIDKANLKIKTSDDLEYKSFNNIGEKVNLVANHKNGRDFVHNINLKLLKDSSVKADTYNTNITFEVVQK